MKAIRLIIIFCITALIALSFSMGTFAVVDSHAEGEQPDMTILPGNQNTGIAYSNSIMSCANMGNWQKFAENSVEAVTDCKTDFVSVDVKLTSDKIPVLMKDDTVDRMCVDSNGNQVKGAVNEKTYEEFSSYFLRYGNGGSISPASEFKTASLKDVLNSLKDGMMLIIDVSFDDAGIAYNTVASEQKLNRVLFRIDGCTGKDAVSIINKNDDFKGLIIPQYNGNIIFGANSLLSETSRAGLTVAKLGTKNVNGVIFYDSFTKKFVENKIMAMFNMTDEYAAGRNDDISGWDDIVSKGYTVIETNHPDMLVNYIEDTEDQLSHLVTLRDMCKAYLNGNYSSSSLDKFTRAYNKATLCIDNVSSRSEISQSYYELSSAYSELEPADKNEAVNKLSFTPGRIIAVVLCGGGIIASQVYLYKKRKK